MDSLISSALHTHLKVFQDTITAEELAIETIAKECISAIESGHKIILFGNGGSAADAQHIAAELVGTFGAKGRRALPAIALTTDTSALTSISNDFSYENVFLRQAEAFVNSGDIVIGISTSGNSANVINALAYAREAEAYVVGLSGNSGGKMNELADTNIVVQSSETPRIQEVHIFIGHMICDIIDRHFA